MSRIAYVNGRYVSHAAASVHVEDRGFQFADGVYEVCAVRGGALVDEEPHLKRLARSLSELKIRAPLGETALCHVLRETVRRNRVSDGLVYFQVSRGQARRDHAFPSPETKPTLVVTARNLAVERYEALNATGVAVITLPDTRWARCDIKSTALLANVLAKQQAREAGAFEAWFVDAQGFVTEGSSSTAWIVDKDGVLRTRKLSDAILPGITRAELIPLCRQHGVQFDERAFEPSEAKTAREAFITAASFGLLRVSSVDSHNIGTGNTEISALLARLYWSRLAGF